jgi:hypothetical protein
MKKGFRTLKAETVAQRVVLESQCAEGRNRVRFCGLGMRRLARDDIGIGFVGHCSKEVPQFNFPAACRRSGQISVR